MNNLAKSFVTWMESESLGIFGKSIFIGGAPANSPDACYWVIFSGGQPIMRNTTGEMQKNYNLQIYYRDIDEEKVYNALTALEELLNAKGCFDLDNFTTLEVQATTFPADQDLENEDRSLALLHATVTVYQND